ncbi:hypothetical protein BB560_000276 [Smittium megazygosporum]|uniref:Phospholipid-transporting ATPase n=1 Tax=Smittium megazygosporum TaxID=133381 RepID=A0A2T9ZKZ9_9FUNG|nr:hypothetical protein BB560_000276 [Smittium megazygosporum]
MYTKKQKSSRFTKDGYEAYNLTTFSRSRSPSHLNTTESPNSSLFESPVSFSTSPRNSALNKSLLNVQFPEDSELDDPLSPSTIPPDNDAEDHDPSTSDLCKIKLNSPLKSRKDSPSNSIDNRKYNPITFLPHVLYDQFKYFLNLYFLLVALSQIFPVFRVGYTLSYFGPLVFVLAVTIVQEWYDDHLRFKRDKQLNNEKYKVLSKEFHGSIQTPSKNLTVGDIIYISKNQRIPADLLILKTLNDDSGSCFIRTDQLDGETDWKLRAAVPLTQAVASELDFLDLDDIYSFNGSVYIHNVSPDTLSNNKSSQATGQSSIEFNNTTQSQGIDINNTIWKDCTLASGSALGVIIYAGKQTRSSLNSSSSRLKIGLFDIDVNFITKILFAVTLSMSFLLVLLDGFRGSWFITMFRFIILFSSIIPIGLRVNLEMGKNYYGRQIQNDKEIEGAIVRTSSIPEELGRLEYILTDKTGTLTCNEMEMIRLHTGNISYSLETMDEITSLLHAFKNNLESHDRQSSADKSTASFSKFNAKAVDMFKLVEALALCHNVTPTFMYSGLESQDLTNLDLEYSASSPDEIAIVEWAKSVGLTLAHRSPNTLFIKTSLYGHEFDYEILVNIPFTSESKRMGVVVKNCSTGSIEFIMKGADSVMREITVSNDWVDEEVSNMAREGLRTLVVAKKSLSHEYYSKFKTALEAAKLKIHDRQASINRVVSEYLEFDLHVLCVTGVEDKLQEGVQSTLELVRNAGFKVWMLTGDKIETAICIAISSKLVGKNARFHVIRDVADPMDLKQELDILLNVPVTTCLVIDGTSLQLCLDAFPDLFISLATRFASVVCSRCSPTQKGEVVTLVQKKTNKRVAAIGDGGNDVGMIQLANVGIGLSGREGQQASLASDIALVKFSHLARLLLWHGRNSYKRSCKLSQFVIHRGLIISVMQFMFSILFYYAPIPLFDGMLVVGYTTVYTMFPVFLLVLDTDISETVAMTYPELYKDLRKGRNFNFKTFLIWLLTSVYQGTIIVILALYFFKPEFIHIVSIMFTSLIINELAMVLVQLHFITFWMVYAQIGSLCIYLLSMFILPTFDMEFILSWTFLYKVLAISAVSWVPVQFVKVIATLLSPSSHSKLD